MAPIYFLCTLLNSFPTFLSIVFSSDSLQWSVVFSNWTLQHCCKCKRWRVFLYFKMTLKFSTLYASFYLFVYFRNPHHDVNVQRSACIWIHSFSPTNWSLPLPWTVLWCSLYLGGLPSSALWETVGAEDEQRTTGWSVPERKSDFARVQVSEMPRTKSIPLYLRGNLFETMCNKVLLSYYKQQKILEKKWILDQPSLASINCN